MSAKTVKVGDRVRVTGVLPNDPDPLEVGDTGTVDMVTERIGHLPGQISVVWDSGRGLLLLDTDPFEVIE